MNTYIHYTQWNYGHSIMFRIVAYINYAVNITPQKGPQFFKAQMWLTEKQFINGTSQVCQWMDVIVRRENFISTN